MKMLIVHHKMRIKHWLVVMMAYKLSGTEGYPFLSLLKYYLIMPLAEQEIPTALVIKCLMNLINCARRPTRIFLKLTGLTIIKPFIAVICFSQDWSISTGEIIVTSVRYTQPRHVLS